MTRLAFLSPELQHRILEGTHPAGLTLAKFLKMDVPLSWEDQERWAKTLA